MWEVGKYKYVEFLPSHFGETNTYVIVFREFGYAIASPKYVEDMEKIKSRINFEYDKILDARSYIIYYNP
jgi:hypothetical protein